MAGRNTSHTLPPRPPLPTQQSNSVPSTPHQRARRDFANGSRSPSPPGLGGGHSPRSVVSEAHVPLTKPSLGLPRCKYETGPPSSRRRMQYNIGDEPLDSPKEPPKDMLDPDADAKLTGDMRELYDRLLPSEESENRRRRFVQKLEGILHKEWPAHEFNVHVFGSSGNLLCTSESDVDICIQTSMKQLETMHMLADVLANNGMERIVCIPFAKVPIVKVWDPELKLASDMNVNNTLAIENTRMIKTYVQIDDRVRPLAMIIKHWAKQRVLNEAGIGGTLSSYAWICMILNFLQTRNPPILPALQQRPHKNYFTQDGSESGFDDNLDQLRGFGADNYESLGQLLFHFFRHYGFEFNYENSVVSVRHGRALAREEKTWVSGTHQGNWRLCVEEPFNSTRNLGNTADPTAFRGIHLEIRSAFYKIADLKLDELCEQYVFPVEEKPAMVKPLKHSTVPKPILAAPTRKHPGSRSNRNNSFRTGNNGPSYRRASSGATVGRNSMPYYSPIPLTGDFLTAEAFLQQWQLMAQAQAQAQVQSAAAAHAQSVVQGSSQSREGSSSSQTPRMPFVTNPATVPLIGNQIFSPFVYPMPMEQTPPMSHSVSQDGARTNPSSPSLSNSVPARRGLQRSSVSSGSQGASIRSQSQPARGLSQNMYMPYPIGYDASGLPIYTYPQPADVAAGYRVENGLRYGNGLGVDVAGDNTPAKEYLGYFVSGDSRQTAPPMPQVANDFTVPTIPPFNGQPSQRNNRPSHESIQPLALGTARRLSRSPSPLGHARHNSTPLRSAPLPTGPSSHLGRPDTSKSADQTRSPSIVGMGSGHSMTNGLLIVNGSSYSNSSVADSETSVLAPVEHFEASSPDEFSTQYFASDSHVPLENGYADAAQYQQALYHQSELLARQQQQQAELLQANGLALQNLSLDPSSSYQHHSHLPTTTTFTSPVQAFPAYVDPLTGSATQSTTSPPLSQEEESTTSPRSYPRSPWHSMPPPNPSSPPSGPPQGLDSHLHHNNSSLSLSTKDSTVKSPGTKSAPVLSPVMETRTPSPSAYRRSENWRPAIVNGSGLVGQGANGTIPGPPSGGNGSAWVNGTLPLHTEPVPPTPLPRAGAATGGPVSTSAITAGGLKSAPSGQAQNQGQPQNVQGQWQQQPGRSKRGGNRKRSKSGPAKGSATTPNSAEGSTKREPVPTRIEDRKGG